MNIREILKVTFNLVVVYTVGGLLLGYLYSLTSPVIYQKNEEEKALALKAMVPEATEAPLKLGDWAPWHKHAELYRVSNADGPIGYIVETYGKGYSSKIQILAALDNDLRVTKINVLHHGETPGLGDEILAEWFRKQYVGKTLDTLVVVKGETDTQIQAITGATISTRAVTGGVRDGIKALMEAEGMAQAEPYTWGDTESGYHPHQADAPAGNQEGGTNEQ